MVVAGDTSISVTGMCRCTAVVCAYIWQLKPSWKCSLAWPRIILFLQAGNSLVKSIFIGKKNLIFVKSDFSQKFAKLRNFWQNTDKKYWKLAWSAAIKTMHCSRVGAPGVPAELVLTTLWAPVVLRFWLLFIFQHLEVSPQRICSRTWCSHSSTKWPTHYSWKASQRFQMSALLTVDETAQI